MMEAKLNFEIKRVGITSKMIDPNDIEKNIKFPSIKEKRSGNLVFNGKIISTH